MLVVTAGIEGSPTVKATVNGLPVYLDNHSIIRLAKENPSRRQRFISALQKRADLLFSITNAVELTGPQGGSANVIKGFLDDIGAHWFPVELDPNLVAQRELQGLEPADACVSKDFLIEYFRARASECSPSTGKVIDLSQGFFRLSAVLDWLEPRRSTFQLRARELDESLIKRIKLHRADFERDPGWLDRSFPAMLFSPRKPATFTYVSLIRELILDAKAYQLKKGDGLDFCHAVIGSAFASFATLDKHWKRRVCSLPHPNQLARIYYMPELDRLVADVERAVEQMPPSG